MQAGQDGWVEGVFCEGADKKAEETYAGIWTDRIGAASLDVGKRVKS